MLGVREIEEDEYEQKKLVHLYEIKDGAIEKKERNYRPTAGGNEIAGREVTGADIA